MNIKIKKIIKNFMVFLFGSFGSKILTFIMLPLYTTILSTGQYGEIDLISTTTALLLPLATLGLVEAIFRFIMSRDYSQSSVLSIGIFVSLLGYGIILLILQIISLFFKWKYMNLMAILLFSSILYEVFTNYLKAVGKARRFALAGIIQTFFALFFNIIFLVVFSLGTRGYTWAYILSYVIPTLFILLREHLVKEIRICYWDSKLAKQMLQYSFPLIFSTLSWWIIMSSDRYMIRFFLGAGAVGIYSVASKIPTIFQTLISIFQTVWQISINEIYEEDFKNLKLYFQKFTDILSVLGVLSGSLGILFTQLIMKIIARNDFYQGWRYVPFLILSVVFSAVTGMVGVLYGAYKDNKGASISVILGALLNIGLNIVLIPWIGILGVTIATALSRLMISIYQLIDTRRFLKFNQGYFSIFINCLLITLQAISLIVIRNNMQYILQLIIFLLLIIYNRKIVKSILKYIIHNSTQKTN